MRVTILSYIDYAGSGYKVWEALSNHTDIDVELYAGPHRNKLHHPSRNIVTPDNIEEVQARVDSSDVIHLKGDWPAMNPYLGLQILHKPVVVTVSGNFFRKKKDGGLEKFNLHNHRKATVRTSFEPDLLYPDFSNIWTPHPVDSIGKPNIWQPSDKPLLLHMPTNRQKKNTLFIIAVLNQVRKQVHCEVQMLEGLTFQQAMETRKRATIFFDQFKVGFYGNSAIEAMQYGIPVACYISPFARSRAPKLRDCPVIDTSDLNIKHWVRTIISTLQSDMQSLSNKTKQWCDDIHSYQVIAAQWREIYERL